MPTAININRFLRALAICLAAFVLHSCKGTKHTAKTPAAEDHAESGTKAGSNSKPKLSSSKKADKVLETAFDFMGTPYKYGACDKSGTDCSGLVFHSFKSVDISLPRSSKDQGTVGTTVNLKNVQKGDLVFFCTKQPKNGTINHVGIVSKIENGTVYFIHATVQKGVMVNNMNEKYYKESYIKASRVLN
jgi:probable lipoprotein NlpC